MPSPLGRVARLVEIGTARVRNGMVVGIRRRGQDRWKAKYRGLGPSDVQRLKSLEDENRRLKKLLAESMLDVAALKDLLANN